MIKNNTKKLFPLIIALYTLLLVIIFTGNNNYYGSMVDWLSQHSTIPDMFRQSFYESKQLIPNFFYQLGGGQNAFYFTYYGFLSPVILVSYLLPFVGMTDYIIAASVVLYISAGVLAYYFLKKHFGELLSFGAAIVYVSLSPINFNFHHHLMFVWYLPFLILALIGLDRFFEKKKPLLFIVSTFLLILTNYFFAVGSLVCLFVYAIYCLLKEDKLSLKALMPKLFHVILIFGCAVLLSGFVLAPTAYGLMANGRANTVVESLKDLIIPDLHEIMFEDDSCGLCGILVACVVGNLFVKKLKISEGFLSGVLLIAVVCPFFSYALNGFLYARGKVLIPFSILFVYALCRFIKNLESNRVYIWKTVIAVAALCGVLVLLRDGNLLFAHLVAASITAAALLKRHPKLIFVYTIPVLIAFIYVNNKNEEYVSHEYEESLYREEIGALLENAEDDWYRTAIYANESNLANYVVNKNYNSTFIYSSTSNSTYQTFSEDYFGNNEPFRNCFIISGMRNELFHTFMGTRYIVSARDPGFFYEPVAKSEHYTLYKNENAFPVVYKSSALASTSQLEKLEFPYTTELLMNYTVADSAKDGKYDSEIVPIPVDESYCFVQEEYSYYKIELDSSLLGKVIYLSFDIKNEGEYENDDDVRISINGIINKLTESSWLYYNGNTRFNYVIPLENSTTLKIRITEGKYDIQNLKMYAGPAVGAEYEEADELSRDAFTGDISCRVDAKKGDYLVTSIPYDNGFKAYVNGKVREVESVNGGFVGIPLDEGENSIVISYTAPLFVIGIFVSLAGVMLLVYLLLKEKIDPLLQKYREIVVYLIFGVLTTLVSVVTYFLCTRLGLDAKDPLQLQIANLISWVVSVTFAFITNKICVFRSNSSALREGIKFYASRLGTLGMDMAIMYVMVTLMGINDVISKLCAQFIVIVSNYAISKFFVFRGENK